MKKLFSYIFNYIKTTDMWLICMCMTASGISCVLMVGVVHSGFLDTMRQVFVQTVAPFIGLVGAIIMSKIDYRFMARLWKLHSVLAYGLVILTFIIGVQRDAGIDDKAWIMLPFGLSLQPAELLKISFIVSFAYHLQKVGSNVNNPKHLFFLCLHGALPIGLIVLQGDDGTALIFAVIFAAMLFAAGLSFKYIIPAGLLAVLSLPLVWFVLLDDNKRMRILTVFNPELDPLGIGWQQLNGLMSLGSGQMWGRGIFYGKHHFVPEIQNDFIFAFIGESLGFVGCVGVLLLITAICFKMLFTSRNSQDLLGKYICVGIFAMFAFQSFLNIGMCLSILPVIGVTLPFFSAGGTSVVTSYLGVGLALSVYMHNKKTLFGTK